MLAIALSSINIVLADQLTEEQVIAWISSITTDAEWQNFLANKGDTDLIKPEMLKSEKVQIAILNLLVPDDSYNLDTKTKFNPVPNNLLTDEFKKLKKSEDVKDAADKSKKGALNPGKYGTKGWVIAGILAIVAIIGIGAKWKKNRTGTLDLRVWKKMQPQPPTSSTPPQQSAEFIVDGLEQIRDIFEIKRRLVIMNNSKIKELRKLQEENSAVTSGAGVPGGTPGAGAAGGGTKTESPEIIRIKAEILRIQNESFLGETLTKLGVEAKLRTEGRIEIQNLLREVLNLFNDIERIERRTRR